MKRTVFLRFTLARFIEDGRVLGYLELGPEACKRKFTSLEEALKAVEVVRAELLQRALEGCRFHRKPESEYTVDLTYLVED